ncbi:NUDIX hydrolase [Pseudomonas sp. dw_358]|uniref:NUDIX hydrolase n=1 Tax=Pseudomonas sp. dw_358 TaxID=2720083 RepID=UPI001BD4EE4D|nr:NUDIX hydrolase [Pseudomonas sp. dw_358]
MIWQPHITVATVVEHDGKFLLVEELKHGQRVLNQPAGHLEANETLQQAAIRETLEETAWDVELTALTGIYLYTAPSNGVTYQRVCFAAKAVGHHPGRELDSDITRALWLTREQILAERERWRSHLLLTCIDDYLAGPVDSLALIRD